MKVEKLVVYGSLSQEQINLIAPLAIRERIKEDKINYSLYEPEVDLTLTKEKFEEKNKPEEIKEPTVERRGEAISTFIEIEEGPAEKNKNFGRRENKESPERNNLLSTLLAALIFGACAFPVTKLLVKSLNFYSAKINANVVTLEASLITALPATLNEEIVARTTFLNAFGALPNYSSDIFKNLVDTTLFGNPKVKITDFKIEAGIYILQVTVTSEKDLEAYLAKIIFSNKLILETAPTEILAGKSYELRIIPFPVF